VLCFEHGQRVTVRTASAALAAEPAPSACPDKDSVPFSAACIAFINGGASPDLRSRSRSRLRLSAVESAHAAEPAARGQPDTLAPACPPSNENAPYSEKCIKFLSGWFWQANPAQTAP
jgi:hypothetical protein